MNELINEVFEDLKTELEDTEDFDEKMLLSKVKNAVRECKIERKYPSYYTEVMIVEDLEQFYTNIRGLALYDYNQIGAEYENSNTENSVTRSYSAREKRLHGIVPLSKTV